MKIKHFEFGIRPNRNNLLTDAKIELLALKPYYADVVLNIV